MVLVGLAALVTFADSVMERLTKSAFSVALFTRDVLLLNAEANPVGVEIKV